MQRSLLRSSGVMSRPYPEREQHNPQANKNIICDHKRRSFLGDFRWTRAKTTPFLLVAQERPVCKEH
jgi:hypothetical protein